MRFGEKKMANENAKESEYLYTKKSNYLLSPLFQRYLKKRVEI